MRQVSLIITSKIFMAMANVKEQRGSGASFLTSGLSFPMRWLVSCIIQYGALVRLLGYIFFMC